MATVTTTKKKKLVYKQDPDGVFRLKKVDNDEPAAAPKPASAAVPDSTAGILNELVDCSYKIVDHTVVPVLPSIPEPIAADPPAPVIPPTPVAAPEPSPVTELPPPASQAPASASGDSSPAHDKKRKKKTKTKSRSSSTPTSPTTPTPSAPRFHWLNMAAEHATNQAKQFHPPSFALGAATAGAVYVSRAALARYALIGFNILKFAILWGVLLIGICWWTGLIKASDTERLSEAFTRMKVKMGLQAEATPQEGNEDEESSEEEEDEVFGIGINHADVASMKSHDSGPKSAASEHSMSSLTDAIPAPPPPTERRNTLTKVTPFKFQPKSDRHQSTPDLHMHSKQSPPKLNRIHTTGLRNTPQKTTPTKVSPRKTRHGSTDSSASYKRLPPYPKEAEELPFINEVKLVSDQASEYTLDDTPPPAQPPQRSNTTMSKKSVLGTRSNYSKFLANVHDDGNED